MVEQEKGDDDLTSSSQEFVPEPASGDKRTKGAWA